MKEFQPYFYLDRIRSSYPGRGDLGYILILIGIVFLIIDFLIDFKLSEISYLIIALGLTIILLNLILEGRSRPQQATERKLSEQKNIT